mmetsp:Transcript_1183/g.2598  ORF Transcript_1183/g.2598 Transcript_1183/m.2598 type:complete len:520 (+) Transcript_1183:533-2092(+)|eukprot:CAMPEP_0178998008 /NCGR_PEP_ID=MMETSP0795-20121207/9292_1 /TAXON_ID=88552 /ORGANISM="Amoebophrya sp., Strain Ameob2" /LENGTH=519 /DNA_ID=CAMNT_0020690675 /DNA_START=498 /DNA_END=2057 /DNA_ORIENTATION=+
MNSSKSGSDLAQLEDLLFGSGGIGGNSSISNSISNVGQNNLLCPPVAGGSAGREMDLAAMLLSGDWGSANKDKEQTSATALWDSLGLGDWSSSEDSSSAASHELNNQRAWNNIPHFPELSAGSMKSNSNSSMTMNSKDSSGSGQSRVEQLMQLRRLEDSMRKAGASDEQIATALESLLWKDLGAMKGERDIAGSLMSKFGGVGGVGGGYGPDRRGNHLGRGGNAGGFGGGAGPYGGPAPELSVNAPGPSGIQPTTWESTATVPGTDRHCYTCSRTFDYRRTHCDNCRQPLSLVDTKQNNWECPCGQPNWLWRKTCRRCLKPRAENAQTMLSSNTDKKVDERPIWNHNIPKTTPAKRPSPTVLAKPAPAVLPPPGFKAKVQSKSAQPGFLPAPQQGQGSVQQGSAPVPTSSDSQNQMNVCPEASDLPSADDPEVQEELRAWMMGAAERELSAETSSHSKQSPTITENNNNISPGILSQNKLSASCRSSFEGKHEASSPNTDGGSGKEDPMVVEGVAAAAA